MDKMHLNEGEMEAVRLSDFEGFCQKGCAERMGISRTTFSRIIEGAHQQIADALLYGKAIEIKIQNKL